MSVSGATASAAFCPSDLSIDAYVGLEGAYESSSSLVSGVDTLSLLRQLRGGADDGGLGVIIKEQSYAADAGIAYATSVAYVAAPALALGVLFLLFFIFASFCRMFGCCCRPSKKEYSKCEKCSPIAIYAVFAVFAGALSIIGLISLLQSTNAITGTLCDVENLREDTSSFLLGITNPLRSIANNTKQATIRVSGRVGNAEYVKTNFSASLRKLRNFSASLLALPDSVRSGSAPHPCDCSFCNTTSVSCTKTVDDLNSSVTPSVNDLSTVEKDVTDQVVAVGDQIIAAANGAVNNTDFMVSFVEVDWKGMVRGGMAAIAVPREWVTIAGISFFGATFVALCLTFLGVFLLACGKYTNCTGVRCIDELDDKAGAWLVFSGWWLMGLVVVIMFLLSGVIIPVSMVMNDACGVMKNFPNDMEGYLGPMMSSSEGGAKGENGRNEEIKSSAQMRSLGSLVSYRYRQHEPRSRLSRSGGFGGNRLLASASKSDGGSSDGSDSGSDNASGDDASGAVNPVNLLIGCYKKKSLLDTLNMTSRFSFTDALNFSALESFDADSAFNFTSFDNMRAVLKNRTSASPNWFDNSRGVNGGTCDRSRASDSLVWMNQDLRVAKLLLNATRNSTVAMHASLKLAEKDLSPLIVEVREFIASAGNCSFLHEHYHSLERRLCRSTLPPLLNVGLAMFLNALFGIFMVAAGLCINMRHGGHGPMPKKGKKNDSDNEGDSDSGAGSDSDSDGEFVQAWDGGKLGRALAAQDASGIEFTEMVEIGGVKSKYVYEDHDSDSDFAI